MMQAMQLDFLNKTIQKDLWVSSPKSEQKWVYKTECWKVVVKLIIKNEWKVEDSRKEWSEWEWRKKALVQRSTLIVEKRIIAESLTSEDSLGC